MSAAVDSVYPPIHDYAVIGNCRTLALVSRDGAIDWLCLPHFSGASIFAALLDKNHGGSFQIRARGNYQTERRYLADTAVLQTEFHTAEGRLRVTDFFVMHTGACHRLPLAPEHELLRLVECIEGVVEIDVKYQPRPDYARRTYPLKACGQLGWRQQAKGKVSYLLCDMPLQPKAADRLTGRCRLKAGQRLSFSLSYSDDEIAVLEPLETAEQRLQTTIEWWQSWCARCLYQGPHREAVMRSALTLKLLSYCLSGAVIAAGTTSLPEDASGARNWDYRYCWLRDTGLILDAFMDLGYSGESAAFLGWLLHATQLTQPRLQVVYDIFGETALDEFELPHLEGYRGIGPVRIGNAAHRQLQLDVYGEVILTAYEFVCRGGRLDRDECELLKGFGHSICHFWRQPDHGIWEIRKPPRHNTYSKLMCWVALDRLIRLEKRLQLGIDREALMRERQAIRTDIDAHAYCPEIQSYVGYYGGRAPDASLLLLARHGYLAHHDPRMLGTYRYIVERLSVDGFLYRYPPGEDYDGVAGTENLFGICSFWQVDYLARLGRRGAAEDLFERLLKLGNDLGLYAEEFAVTDKTPRGNFPQGFTHVGLITAALALAEQNDAGIDGGDSP